MYATIKGEEKVKQFQNIFCAFEDNYHTDDEDRIVLNFNKEGLKINFLEEEHIMFMKVHFKKDIFDEYPEHIGNLSIALDLTAFTESLIECSDYLEMMIVDEDVFIIDNGNTPYSIDCGFWIDAFKEPTFDVNNETTLNHQELSLKILRDCFNLKKGISFKGIPSKIHSYYAAIVVFLKVGEEVTIRYNDDGIDPLQFVLSNDFVDVEILIAPRIEGYV